MLRNGLPAIAPTERYPARVRDFSETDWQELTLLIAEAPPGRMQVAMSRVSVLASSKGRKPATRLLTGFDRILHLAAISSGSDFDKALLVELRRLNVH